MGETNEIGWWRDNYVARDRAKTARYNHQATLARGRRRLLARRLVDSVWACVFIACMGFGIVVGFWFLLRVLGGRW